MESQPQNPEFRINPENFHPCFMSHVSTSRNPCINKATLVLLMQRCGTSRPLYFMTADPFITWNTNINENV